VFGEVAGPPKLQNIVTPSSNAHGKMVANLSHFLSRAAWTAGTNLAMTTLIDLVI
jgi:hypothetical protein